MPELRKQPLGQLRKRNQPQLRSPLTNPSRVSMRNAGANLVDNSLKTALIAEREVLLQLRHSCENVYEGIPLPEGQPAVPDLKTLKKKLDLLRKQEACLEMAISNAVLQAQALMG